MPYNGPLASNELVGVWVITDESLHTLQAYCGYLTFTNRTDHLIKLNGDGSCVYRTLDDFEAQIDPTEVIGEYKDYGHPTWYAWEPLSQTITSGPFDDAASITNGILSTNRWARWRLIDSGATLDKKVNQFDVLPGDLNRYRILFTYPEDSDFLGIGGRTWFLEKQSDQLTIWKYSFSIKKRIVFKRITSD